MIDYKLRYDISIAVDLMEAHRSIVEDIERYRVNSKEGLVILCASTAPDLPNFLSSSSNGLDKTGYVSKIWSILPQSDPRRKVLSYSEAVINNPQIGYTRIFQLYDINHLNREEHTVYLFENQNYKEEHLYSSSRKFPEISYHRLGSGYSYPDSRLIWVRFFTVNVNMERVMGKMGRK